MNNKSCIRSVANLRKRHKKLAKDLANIGDTLDDVIKIALLRDMSMDLQRSCNINLASLRTLDVEDADKHIASLQTTAKNFCDLRNKACTKLEALLAPHFSMKLDHSVFAGMAVGSYVTALCSEDYSSWKPVKGIHVNNSNGKQLTVYAMLLNNKTAINYGFVPHYPPSKHWVVAEPEKAIKSILKANGI